MRFLSLGKLELTDKMEFVDGLIPFVSDFLNENKTTISVTDTKKQKEYLKMIDTVFPECFKFKIDSDSVEIKIFEFINYLSFFTDLISVFLLI